MGSGRFGTFSHDLRGDNLFMTFSTNTFEGLNILVTGASSGIGKFAALHLANLGANIIVSGRNAERLNETLSTLPGAHHKAIATELNDMESAAALVAAAAAEGNGLDGIFHCAGLELVRPMRLVKQNNIDDVFGAAVFGTFGVAKAASRAGVMKPNASIVLMSSVAGSRGRSGMALYSAAKAANDGFIRSLACELAPKGVRVNGVAAGGVETEMHARLTQSMPETAIEDYRSAHLLGFGKPEDVANAVAFLLSGASRWITGTTLVVDGGYLAS